MNTCSPFKAPEAGLAARPGEGLTMLGAALAHDWLHGCGDTFSGQGTLRRALAQLDAGDDDRDWQPSALRAWPRKRPVYYESTTLRNGILRRRWRGEIDNVAEGVGRCRIHRSAPLLRPAAQQRRKATKTLISLYRDRWETYSTLILPPNPQAACMDSCS